MVPPIQRNPLIESIAVLQSKSGKEDALDILKRVAHNVSYLMKEENFKVKQLVEFYPRDRSLLGMNVNKGMKIMLRLRDPADEYRFLPIESIMGTMLHELTHNLHGPHDQIFYQKLDHLSGRQWTIAQLGLYNSFIGSGNKLGRKHGGSVIVDRTFRRGKGRKLGGTRIANVGTPKRSAREMAAVAAEKRAADNKICRVASETAQFAPLQEDLVIEILEDDYNIRNDKSSSTRHSTSEKVEIIDLT
ncbi:unnamed protein product [Kluyveromyces dobzhanskii CBS 2104]|uniref:WGS project CCBQ000000000 data, contig 00058 n=1 Tax=Kluyveromyces dobzhanskii CBS 2104 TaxID=1427455 RepID=A0A0A8LBY7_9SACH|nr:unnamed protein product [Kluyveromyces dobzhanskii CBS 2104]